jgi:thioredoxin 1
MKYLLALACLFICMTSCVETEYVYRTKIVEKEKCVFPSVKEIMPSAFDVEVLNAKEDQVLVEFSAPWCSYCNDMIPVIKEVAEETCLATKVVRIDVDNESPLYKRYGIETIPTMIVFRHSLLYKKHIGLASKEEVLELLK